MMRFMSYNVLCTENTMAGFLPSSEAFASWIGSPQMLSTAFCNNKIIAARNARASEDLSPVMPCTIYKGGRYRRKIRSTKEGVDVNKTSLTRELVLQTTPSMQLTSLKHCNGKIYQTRIPEVNFLNLKTIKWNPHGPHPKQEIEMQGRECCLCTTAEISKQWR